MNDFKAGCAAGVGLVVTGHPFDTLKTWKQTSTVVKNKNIFTLYRGVAFPLVGQTFINASLFGFQDYYSKKLTNGNKYLAGSLAGITSCVLITPVELYKVRAQKKLSLYSNPYKGLSLTIMRESISAGLYFGSYFSLKDRYFNDNPLGPLYAGGLAGLLCWSICYPVDVIKTRIQSDISFKTAISQKNLYAGISWCLIRAFIANSAAFGCYEWAKKLI
jgi:solute carrier family 25 (mitochondrial carnitine/acylcarnitine transporter), member 20/29